jgi:hypothetical protein
MDGWQGTVYLFGSGFTQQEDVIYSVLFIMARERERERERESVLRFGYYSRLFMRHYFADDCAILYILLK